MINTSETRISAVVAKADGQKAIDGLLQTFRLS